MAPSVLITGTSKGGIGDSLAHEFHRRGYKVFATARNLQKVQHFEQAGITVVKLDVTEPETIKSAVKEVEAATGGRLDILVNNSGTAYSMTVLDSDIEAVKQMFDVNFFGVLRVTQAFSPLVIAARGKIINISSIAGEFPNNFTGAYNASKAALSSISDSMRIELAPFGVKVTTVLAGTVATNLLHSDATISLPPGSRYLPIQSQAEPVLNGRDLQAGAMDPAKFAKRVVNEATRTSPTARLWYGTNAALIWFMTTFFRHTFLDSMLSKQSGLAALAKLLSRAH
ncbi:hypothetical protein NLU13_9076 [Sarocladium strictum]|uniref:NAD(P)-binding protein n=1 Tax=Sarocladium strictum TaxID=5046 RepID=A0AA39L3U7_SARSR|nr:hypothetical protein NLU13_9076 [Sarocladium strictum]